jgi:glycosyltransferase involved in cell wall biosynthesis
MNEEQSIGLVLDSVHTTLSKAKLDHEMLIVDTNSKDRTREIAKEKGARVIEEPRRGYGRAYKTGFENAKGDIIVTLDADCTYPAEDIPKLIDILNKEDLDFITTNRFAGLEQGAMTFEHHIGNKLLTMTMNVLFRVKVKDSQSGMWVFRRDKMENMNLKDDGMAMSEEIKIEAFKKLRSKEVSIYYRRRVGDVKLSSWKDGYKNIRFLFQKCFEYQ